MLTRASIKPSWPRQGFTLLESLMLLIVFTSSLVLTAQYVEQIVDERSATAAAQQLKTLSHQVQQLVSGQWPLILQQLEMQRQKMDHPGYPCSCELPEALLEALKGQVNPYQQHYRFRVLSEAAGRWQLWITTHGGRAIPQRAWSRIRTSLGPSLGYTRKDKKNRTIIRRQQNFRSKPWPDELGLGLDHDPNEGHLVAMLDLDPREVTSANCLLYRKTLVGAPQRNSMETPLALQKNQIVFSSGSFVGPQEWLLKEGDSSLRATLDQSSTSPSIILTDSENNQAILTATALSTVYPRPLNSTSIWLADQEYTEQKSKSTLQKMTGGLLGKNKSSLSPVAQQYGSQLHPLWNQLPYHTFTKKSGLQPLLAIESSHKQKFADDLCRLTTDTLSALGRLFILGPQKGSQHSLFICGKSEKEDSLQAYLWKDFDHYRPSLCYTERPPFIIVLPKKIENKDQASKLHRFMKVFIERNLYHHYAREAYTTYPNNQSRFTEDILYKFDNLMKEAYQEGFLTITADNIKTILKELYNLYPYESFKGNSYSVNGSHITTFKSAYKALHTNQFSNPEDFKNNYNNKTYGKRIADFLKYFEKFNRIKNAKTLTENNQNNDNIFIYVTKITHISFYDTARQQEFPEFIKFPIGISLKKDIKNSKEEINKLSSFLIKATADINKWLDSGNSFKKLNQSISKYLIVSGEVDLEEFKKYYQKKLNQKRSNLHNFITSLEDFETFFTENYSKTFDKDKAGLIKWRLIDLARDSEKPAPIQEQPSPIQLIFRDDKSPSHSQNSLESLPTADEKRSDDEECSDDEE